MVHPCLLAQQHSPGLLMIIEPEISRCGRDAWTFVALFSAALIPTAVAHTNATARAIAIATKCLTVMIPSSRHTKRTQRLWRNALGASCEPAHSRRPEIRHFVIAVTVADACDDFANT